MNRYAIVRNGAVDNVTLWDGDTKTWAPPEDAEMVLADETGDAGDLWDGEQFSRPPQTEPPPLTPDPFEALTEKLIAKGILSAADVDDMKKERGK